MKGVEELYSELAQYESRKRQPPYPVHKRLKFQNPHKSLLDWVMENVEFDENDHP